MINKSFLIGLGLGLLLATATLQLDYWSKNKQQPSQTQMTIEELREEAKKYDYELKTKREMELEIKNAIEQYKNNQPSSGIDNNKTSQATSKKTSTSISVKIKPGLNATEVADYLLSKGVVKDKEALVNALKKISKTRQIPARSYNLEPNSDPMKIAKLITGKK